MKFASGASSDEARFNKRRRSGVWGHGPKHRTETFRIGGHLLRGGARLQPDVVLAGRACLLLCRSRCRHRAPYESPRLLAARILPRGPQLPSRAPLAEAVGDDVARHRSPLRNGGHDRLRAGSTAADHSPSGSFPRGPWPIGIRILLVRLALPHAAGPRAICCVHRLDHCRRGASEDAPAPPGHRLPRRRCPSGLRLRHPRTEHSASVGGPALPWCEHRFQPGTALEGRAALAGSPA